MSNERRRSNGRQRNSKSRRSQNGARQLLKRTLFAERLETRALMAADANPFHNSSFGLDVNGDNVIAPNDVLAVINALNTYGPAPISILASQMNGGAEAEPGSATPMKVDVDDDGFLSSRDALMLINRLNGEGEAGALVVRLEAVTLSGAAITGPIATGSQFLVRGFVDDSRTLVPQTGVFAAYLDLVYPSSIVAVNKREVQVITISGDPNVSNSNPTGGTFTLTFDGQTTTPISYSDDGGGVILPAPTAIRAALESLSNVGTGNVEVTRIDAGTATYTVKFGGKFANQNVANITGNAAGLTGGTGARITVVENPNVRTDTPANTAADLFRNSITYGPRYQNGKSANDGEAGTPGVIDELGAFAGTQQLGGNEQLLFTVEMTATGGGAIAITTNKADESPGHDVLFYGTPEVRVDPADIIFGSLNLTATQTVNAVDDAATVVENSSNNLINVLANDTIATAGTLQIVSVTSGANGTATINNNGTPTNFADDRISFTPATGFSGTATFTYTAGDGLGNTDIATVTVSVGNVNDAPVITLPPGNPPSTAEDTAIVFSRANGNMPTFSDSDADTGNVVLNVSVGQGNLTLSSTAGLSVTGNGTGSISVTGTIAAINTALDTVTLTYQPNLNFNGADNLVLNLNDKGNTGTGGEKTDQETVPITVTAVNDAPVNTVPVAQSITEDDTLTFNAANGTAISIADVDANPNSVLVTVTVQNGVLTAGSTTGVTGNGTASLTITGTVTTVNAALNGLVYDPNTNFTGTDTLSITTNDQGNTGSGGAKSDNDTVSIDVQPNVRPRARNDAVSVDEDSTNNSINVLANDIANDGASVTLKSFTQPTTGGSVTLFDNGTPANLTDDRLIFTPTANFFGTSSFTYTINDTLGTGADNTGTVTVTVRESNDAPTAANDTLAAQEDTPLTFPASNLTSNDSAGPLETNQTLTVTQVAATSGGGTVTLNGNGTITYTPALNFNGPFTFTYTVTDNGTTNGAADPKTATATVTVNVAAVNDAPTAGADSASTNEDVILNLPTATVLSNDSAGGGTDENGQTLSITAVNAVSGGTASLSGSNIVFTPTPDFFGTATLTYTVADNGSPVQSATGTITIAVKSVNDAPVPTADSVTAIKNSTTTYTVASLLANDSVGPANEAGQTLSITAVSATSTRGGTVTLNTATGVITYVAPNGQTGADSFTYTVTDNGTSDNAADPKSATGTVNINILDFVPSSISGFVYADSTNIGVRDASEPGLGGVAVRLTGTNAQGQSIDVTVRTGSDGAYNFGNLSPGTYFVTEGRTVNLVDGEDTPGVGGTKNGTDSIRVVIPASGGVNSVNNFGEQGFTSAYAGAFNPLLASSHENGSTDNGTLSNGLIFSFENTTQSQLGWYLKLKGWSGYTPVSLVMAADRNSALLTVLNSSNQQLQVSVSMASGRLRYRDGGDGQSVVQIVGTAADFTFASTNGAMAGEGEGDSAVEAAVLAASAAHASPAGEDYSDAADAVFAGNGWLPA